VDTLLGDYHDQLTHDPKGFDDADHRQFLNTAQGLRDRVAAQKTLGDTAGQGVDLVKGAVESEVGTHVAAAADLSATNPDGSLRVPGSNMARQSLFQAQKIKDTAQRAANPTAEKKIDDALESIHQNVRNGNFPVAGGEAQEKWIDGTSANFNPQREQWFNAVQGTADPNTPEGKKQLAHTQEQTLAHPENRALFQEFIRTGNEDRWKELEHNLKKTPQRAQTEEDQEKSLQNDSIVGFLNNATGTDFSEHMKGAAGAIVGHVVPGIGNVGKGGKASSRLGKYAGKAARIGADIGNTVVQNTIENPDSDFEDHKKAVIESYATSLGMKPLEHGMGKISEKIGSHLPRRPGAGDTGSPSAVHPGGGGTTHPGSQSFDAGIAAETGVMFTPGDNPQRMEEGAHGQPVRWTPKFGPAVKL
jgi:hypothetical protein